MKTKTFVFFFVIFGCILATKTIYGVCQAKATYKQHFWSLSDTSTKCIGGDLGSDSYETNKDVYATCKCDSDLGSANYYKCQATATAGWFWTTKCVCKNGWINDDETKSGACVCDCTLL